MSPKNFDTCGKCASFIGASCFRFPPQVIVRPTVVHHSGDPQRIPPTETQEILSVRPQVSADDFACGEFKLSEKLANFLLAYGKGKKDASK